MNDLARMATVMSVGMTIKQVAEALGTAESTIRNKARELFPELTKNGLATFLDENQVSIIKKNLVPRDLTLKSKLENATTSLDIEEMTIKVISYHKAEADRLRYELAIALPKAAFYDQVIDSKTAIPMRDVAAVLNLPGWGRNKIFSILRERKILDDKNIPYREYQDRGYFRVVEQAWMDDNGENHVSLKTLIYQRGIDFIRKLLEGI